MYKFKIRGSKLIECEMRNFPIRADYNEVIVVPNRIKKIGEYAFQQCAAKDIILPDGIEEIEDYAFDRSLSPENETSYKGSTYLGSRNNPFMVLVSVEEVDDNALEIHPNTRFIDSEAYKKERWWYKNAPTLILGNKLEFIGMRAFDSAHFTKIEVPETVKRIRDEAFYKCAALETVTLPSALRSIEDSVFNKCVSLKNITLPKELVSVGSYAFAECSSLPEITLPNTMEQIGKEAFARCTALKRVVLGDSIKKNRRRRFPRLRGA